MIGGATLSERTRNFMKLQKKAILAAAAVAVMLLSILAAARFATSPDFHAETLTSLEEKQATVLELTAASTAASAAISLLPGDAATPIADKLADLSGSFLIVLCAIYLEKFLLLLTGYASFYFLIPLACLLYLGYLAKGWEGCKALARKMFLFALAIVLVIPASVKFSDLIEETYHDSIAATIQHAKETAQEAEEASASDSEEGTVLSKIVEGITNAASGAVEKASRSVNRFLEALAIMLVTSCVIPILVLLFFVWLIKAMFSAPLLTRPALPAAQKAAEREKERV